MAKTIQIRNIDDKAYAALRRRAAEDDISVPDPSTGGRKTGGAPLDKGVAGAGRK